MATTTSGTAPRISDRVGMPSESSSSPDQIPFARELARKPTHLGAMIIPGGYYFFGLEKSDMLTIMIPIAGLMLLIDIARLRNWQIYHRLLGRLVTPMIREHEHVGDFSGAMYILLSVCLTVALYPKPIAIAALSFIIIGDILAALIGRKFGRHKFGRKSIEGSVACLAGTLAVAALAPEIPLMIGVFGAVVATVTEAVSLKIDDNVSVPIVSGLAMTLLGRILG